MMEHKVLKFGLVVLGIILYGAAEGLPKYIFLAAIGCFLYALWGEIGMLEDIIRKTENKRGKK